MAKQCTHLDQIKDVAPNTPDGCEECLAMGSDWVHLRLCLSCGHVGCCDSSPNKHATRHFDAAAKLACVSELGFYINESECISHHLITTAIRGALEKIGSQVPRNLQAESIEDWFKYNLPGEEMTVRRLRRLRSAT